MTYITPPDEFPAFPGRKTVRPKTGYGGGKLSKQWKDDRGDLYEWDGLHARLERYDARGKHLGEYDPTTGTQTKPADKTRRIEP